MGECAGGKVLRYGKDIVQVDARLSLRHCDGLGSELGVAD